MSQSRLPIGAEPARCLPPNAPVHRSERRLPPGACDAHAHVFGPAGDHPLDPARGYTPSLMTIADYRAVMDAYGIERAVLVQPSVYGFDNGALLAALAAMPDRLRGIAVIPPDAPDEVFAEAHRLGVRGVRVNPRNPAGLAIADIPRVAARIKPLGWHIQLQIEIGKVPNLADIIARAGVPVVVDHFGFPDVALGPDDAAFGALVALAAHGQCHVKLSAPHRLAGDLDPLAALTPFVRRLVAEAPDRLLWALDWPHTECFETVPDDGTLVDLAWSWFPSEDLRQTILVDNPGRLYFGQNPATDGRPMAGSHP